MIVKLSARLKDRIAYAVSECTDVYEAIEWAKTHLQQMPDAIAVNGTYSENGYNVHLTVSRQKKGEAA